MSNPNDFVIENGVLTKYVGPGGDVVVPEGVTEIGDWTFQYCDKLKSIVIPKSTERIGQYAFDTCSKLTTIILQDGLTTIGDWAFHDCGALEGIRFPDSLVCIGNWALSGCDQLSEIYIPASVTQLGSDALNGCTVTVAEDNACFCSAEGALFSKDQTKLLRCPKKSEGEYMIPERVTSIGDHAFSFCSKLKEIVIPVSVVSIGESAFSGCSDLESITIPERVTSIGDNAFQFCSKLKEITVPSGVTIIGKSTFEMCGELYRVVLPVGISSIGSKAFAGCEALNNVVIPESVQNLGEGAFRFCKSLENVIIPDGITTIEKDTFAYCSNLKSVILPDSVKEVHEKAFGPGTIETGVLVSDPKLLPLTIRRNGAIGFAEAGKGRDDAGWTANSKYIKANAEKLVDTAMAHPALLSLMCREKLIPPKNAELFLEASRKTGSAEPISLMLDYQANKISAKEKEKLENKKQETQDTVMNRMIARQDKAGIEGLNIAVTGGLETFRNRKELEAFAAEQGATVKSSLSAKVDYLIMNDPESDSAKVQKAKELEIEVISERRFNELAGRLFTIEDGVLLRYNGAGGDVTIPENVTAIGRSAFEGCRELVHVRISLNIRKIGSYAFEDCPKLIICAPAKSHAIKYAKSHSIPFMEE